MEGSRLWRLCTALSHRSSKICIDIQAVQTFEYQLSQMPYLTGFSSNEVKIHSLELIVTMHNQFRDLHKHVLYSVSINVRDVCMSVCLPHFSWGAPQELENMVLFPFMGVGLEKKKKNRLNSLQNTVLSSRPSVHRHTPEALKSCIILHNCPGRVLWLNQGVLIL